MKTKCPFCRLNNTLFEFNKHKSESSFRMLELQARTLHDNIKLKKSIAGDFCDAHLASDPDTLADSLYSAIAKIKEGLQLRRVPHAVRF